MPDDLAEYNGDAAQNQDGADQAEKPSSQDWRHDFKRLIRRGRIEKELGNSKSLREIIGKVREFEDRVGLDQLIESFISNEIIVDPVMAEVANYVFEVVSQKHPEVLAVVLLGSSVHGGAKVRELTETSEPDLDWGIITQEPIRPKLAEVIENTAKAHLPEIIKKFNLNPEFHFCVMINPARDAHSHNFFPGLRSTTAKNPEHLKDILTGKKPGQSFDSLTSWLKLDPADIAVLYLQPSFPPEVNQHNRAMLLEALKLLARQDHKIWRATIERIMYSWRDAHGLKLKHFGSQFKREKDLHLALRVSHDSASIMDAVMKELLEATGRAGD